MLIPFLFTSLWLNEHLTLTDQCIHAAVRNSQTTEQKETQGGYEAHYDQFTTTSQKTPR